MCTFWLNIVLFCAHFILVLRMLISLSLYVCSRVYTQVLTNQGSLFRFDISSSGTGLRLCWQIRCSIKTILEESGKNNARQTGRSSYYKRISINHNFRYNDDLSYCLKILITFQKQICFNIFLDRLVCTSFSYLIVRYFMRIMVTSVLMMLY